MPQQEGSQPSQKLQYVNYAGHGNSASVDDFGTLAINGVAHFNELPSAANPDFNFKIFNWSNIAIYNTTSLLVDPNSFDFQVYSGSFQNDGIGEDSFTGSAKLAHKRPHWFLRKVRTDQAFLTINNCVLAQQNSINH